MLFELKTKLVGQVIQDAGIVNRAGEKHVRLMLSDSTEPLFAKLEDVMITLASRKPMGKALNISGPNRIIKVS